VLASDPATIQHHGLAGDVLAAGLARKATVPAISEMSINCFFGIGSSMILLITSSSVMPFSLAWEAICFSTNGVLTYDGQMVLTVMSVSPVSSASVLEKPIRPCLAAT
tara:strand:- start:14025 stop:14348 length:324 start_codon:yes stop_codon:yes gene_type:complete